MKFIKKIFNKIKKHNEKEYHKRMLNFILFNSIAMMWCSYILAWYDKTEIAESLSETIVNVIVGVTIPYFITKTVENISKYGSRINRTTKEQEQDMCVVDMHGIIDSSGNENIYE